MTTYNTGNPIGSTDPRDLYDNAQNLDTAMHTAATTWADRLGNLRPSWAGATGYQSLGDYAAGIQVTTYNQVIRAAGEYWRAAAGTALPYTTTGAGMPESGKFVSVGDAVLRADLVEGDGSSIVGFQQAGTGAVVRTAQDKMRESVTPEDFGAVGDGVADDSAAVQKAIDSVGAYGTVTFRAGGQYKVGSLTVSNIGVTLQGNNSNTQGRTVIIGYTDGVPILNITAPQSRIVGLLFMGLSNEAEKGADTTQDGVVISAPASSHNIDAHVDNCGFVYLRRCVEMRGRNLKIRECIFSNSDTGVYVGNNAIPNLRGLILEGNRFHYMTKSGSSGAVVYCDPSANLFDVAINGYADGCLYVYRGFSGITRISDMIVTRGRAGICLVDATSCGLNVRFRAFFIRDNFFESSYPDFEVGSYVISVVGAGDVTISGNHIIRCPEVAIRCDSHHATITDNRVSNAGMRTDATYSAFLIPASGCMLAGNTVVQDRNEVPANKMKAAFELTGVDTMMGSNFVSNMQGKEYLLDSTKRIFGQTPFWVPRREAQASAAPTTGTWYRGDVVWNTAPSASTTPGWVCVTAGTPGTWKAMASLEA